MSATSPHVSPTPSPTPSGDTTVGPAATTVSIRPAVLPSPGRAQDLALRVTVPTTGERLPVIVFSHGFGADDSLAGFHGYGTLPTTPAENPALLALVRQVTTAHLRTALGVDEASFPAAGDALAGQADPAGRLESNADRQ